MPETLVGDAVWQELLIDEVAFVGMSIFIVFAVAKLGHELGWCVAQMQWHRKVACGAHKLES